MRVDVQRQVDLCLGDMQKGTRIIGGLFPGLMTVEHVIRFRGDLRGESRIRP
jgi:hypothetical protein